MINSEVRWKLRERYILSYKQWGPSVLRHWAIRTDIGCFSATTIAKVIEDLRPPKQEKEKPNRYEIVAPMVMWSEDGTAFKDGNKKRELMVLQDECSRYKVATKLADGAADESDVLEYLREAFLKKGAPLILKHDNAAYQNTADVKKLCDEFGVVWLNSPPSYPPFNGKKERSMRDIKSYEAALRRHRVATNLSERIELSIKDLNNDRPRPVLGGQTAQEVFEARTIDLPDRAQFLMRVNTRKAELKKEASDRHEKQAARRRAIIEVLTHYGLINWKGNVSTNSETKTGTD